MAQVQFTRHLERFFPGLEEIEVEAQSVAQLVVNLERRHPGIAGYLIDDQGALRKHVNVFIDDEMVRDRLALSDAIGPGSKVYIMQALSGG